MYGFKDDILWKVNRFDCAPCNVSGDKLHEGRSE